jgi:hypothetical protein
MITCIAPAGAMTTVKGQKNDFSAAMMECPPVPPPLAGDSLTTPKGRLRLLGKNTVRGFAEF